MEIKVEVVKVLPIEEFEGKSGRRVRHGFVGRYVNGSYPNDVKFSVLGDERWLSLGIVVGCQYDLSFDLRSREWNGRWYTDVDVWKAVKLGVESPQSKPTANANPPVVESNTDDLPF